MANEVFNIARGSVMYLMEDATWAAGLTGGLDPANSRMVIVVLEANEADDTLNNYDDLNALLGQAGNTEATATNLNSPRDETDDLGITVNVDDTANDAEVVKDADVTWTSVSGTATTKLLCCYDADNAAGTDANILPMTHHDFSVTPNGGDITADFDQTNGFWRST